MGGGSSKPSGPTKAAPIVVEDPPPIPGIVSFGLGDAQGCQWPGKRGVECRLTVAAGISSSGAKLYREQGTITETECNRFQTDVAKVRAQQMSFEEFKTNLKSGLYYERVPSGVDTYCKQIVFAESDLKDIPNVDSIAWTKARNPTIRKMTAAGGYSSITKLFIKPSIPFKVTFNGETFTISLMTLFHPSPVRLENVQHDAMLTLGDPGVGNRAKGSSTTDAVILVPLVGSLNAGPSGDFISKIARYMTAVLQPDPVTGQYKTIDIPTGNDWDLSKLFPGTPSNGETVVATGYYAWSASGGVVKSTNPTITARPFPQADIWKYPYIAAGKSNVRYLMLKDPVPVNVFDLQTVRMLPATPAEQAIDSFIPSTLSFVTPKTCSTTPSAAGRESMTNPEQCDPFAAVQSNALSKDTLVNVIIGALTTFGVILAIYFAVKLFANTDWGFKLPRWGHLFGNFAINAPLDEREKIPASTLFTPTREEKDIPFSKEMGEAAEARLSAASGTNPIERVSRAKAAKEARIEADAKAKADEEARLIEEARIEAEAEAKAKADEEARLIEETGKEAEAEAKKRAEENARIDAEAKTKFLAMEEANRRAAEIAERDAAAEKRRLEATPAGTGLFDVGDLRVTAALEEEAKREEKELADAREAEKEAEVLLKRAKDVKKELDAAKAETAKKAADADAAARAVDNAERKARERAAIEAKDIAETAPADARRRTRTRFDTSAKTPPSIAEAVKAKEAESAAKEAAAKAAAKEKAIQDKYAKMAMDAFKKQEEEAEMKRKAEEAAKSASKAAERQADLLKRAEEERKKQAEEYAAKQKEEAARAFRPTSGRPTAAVPKAEGAPAKNPREHAPPSDAEVKEVLDAVASTAKDAKAAGRTGPAPKPATPLGESETKQERDKLKTLKEAAYEMLGSAIQSTNFRRSLWKNRSVWMRFEEEKKHHTQFLKPLVKRIVAYQAGIDASPLSGLPRIEFENALKELTGKAIRLLEESKRRMTTVSEDAPPTLFRGGRRRMKRKSTRRYVA